MKSSLPCSFPGFLAGLLPFLLSAQTVERPNLVLILADDLGFSDIRCYGGEIETPHLDRLAEKGIRYTDFHNAARCCPTRASLLTGLYPHEAGVGAMVYHPFDGGYLAQLNDNCTTLAEMLGKSNYQTLMSGKWHVGHKVETVRPELRGFDQFYGTYLHVDSYFKVLPGCDIWLNGELQIPGRMNQIPENPINPEREFYTTDVYTDFALRFLGEACKKPEPFFLYLAYNAPHWPLEAPDRLVEKYRDRYHEGWNQLRSEKFERMKKLNLFPEGTRLPESENTAWNSLPEEARRELAFRRAIYAAQVDSLDENIGRVVKHLEQEEELDNTLILFLSDNGCSAEVGLHGYSHRKNRIANFADWRTASGRSSSQGQAWAEASNTPFRKYKKDTYEGGSCTPLIAHWPAGIDPSQEGTFCRETGHIIDVMATFAELSGGELPGKAAGRSLCPTFSGKALKARSQPLCWEHLGNRAIRDGDWKLVSTYQRDKTSAWELYHLADDRTEIQNLAPDQPELVAELSRKWNEWAKASGVLPDFHTRRARQRAQEKGK